MPSQIIKVLVKEKQLVKPGDALVILSSMKMENTIISNTHGMVTEVFATEGASVNSGYILLKINSEN
jgi:biotin carboxyl carrier protein